MPDLPSPYQMRDWKDVARKYDDLVYSTLVKTKSSSTNYPGLQPILLESYIGGNDNAAEAINIIPSIVGASLVGKDKLTWAQKTKDFFNKANQQNIYLNGYSNISGNDWWYDVMPSVFFYQMYTQYSLDARLSKSVHNGCRSLVGCSSSHGRSIGTVGNAGYELSRLVYGNDDRKYEQRYGTRIGRIDRVVIV
ncbi:MAG: hypothetical protein WDO15_09165 [Bacteroidota bacterium]